MKKPPVTNMTSFHSNGMYLFVFTSRVSFFCVGVLLLSILLQPIETVFANSEPVPDITAVEVVENIPDAETTVLADGEVQEPNLPTEAISVSESEPELTDQTPVATVEEVEVDSDTEAEQATAFGTDDSLINETSEVVGDIGTTTDESLATTTDSGETVTAVVYSDSVVQFDKDACVLVSDGSFYCQQDIEDDAGRPDGIYSLPDKDGDLEIFLQAGEELTQITFNTHDDSSPYFDSESNTMVWHRLLDDRYQIISYDVASGEETQLTQGGVNSMEPTRSGEFTVWQQWDNNWEVVLYDGNTKRQLTHSVEHDVSPSIRNGLVVWYRLSDGDDKNIQLYNIKTGEFTTIEDSDGGTISNPRMVVVYETTYENGDVVTKGYDLVTGEIISLDASPVELPDTIPSPESTGETRALLQPKPVVKEDIENDTATPTSEPPPPEIGEFDLVVGTTTLQLGEDVVPVSSSSAPIILSEYTLDLSVPEMVQSEPEFTIEDIVIPAYVESAPTTDVTQ